MGQFKNACVFEYSQGWFTKYKFKRNFKKSNCVKYVFVKSVDLENFVETDNIIQKNPVYKHYFVKIILHQLNYLK